MCALCSDDERACELVTCSQRNRQTNHLLLSYDRSAMKSKIDTLIEENPVLMLSFTTCPFCLKAKAVLNAKGVNFKAVELDTDPEGYPMRAEMAEMVGRTSVPAIWIGGTFIGKKLS